MASVRHLCDARASCRAGSATRLRHRAAPHGLDDTNIRNAVTGNAGPVTWPSLHRALAALGALTLAVLTLGAASQPRERQWDKPRRTVEGPVEYFVTMTTHVPDGTAEQTVEDVKAREA